MSVKHSCESILESFVSIYENIFDNRRPTAAKSTHEEFEVAVNGPNLAHGDYVVKESWTIFGPVDVGSSTFTRPQLASVLETNSQV